MRLRNWSKPKRTFWQLLRIKATKRVLQFADKLEDPKIQFLKSLKLHAEHTLHPKDYELIACPENLEVLLDRIGFADLFFPEEFQKLQQGLINLFSNYGSAFSTTKEDINKWFSDVYDSKFGNANTFYLRSLDFTRKTDDSFRLLESASIHLKYIARSFIVLSIIVKPSEIFIKDFTALIRSVPSSQSEILSFNLRQGITSAKGISTWRVRQAELEEFFLEINKSIVLLFRTNFGVGLSLFGSLPCIEIIYTNISLQEIPEAQFLSNHSTDFLAAYRFFEALGYPYDPHSIYSECDWWKFYEVPRNEVFYQTSNSYQLLISSVDCKKISSPVKGGLQNSEFSISTYTIYDLLSLLAIEHFYNVLERLVKELKSELELPLSNQIKGTINLNRFKSAISKMVRLNGFYFQHTRMWTSVNQDFFFDYLCSGANTLSRRKFSINDPGLLKDDKKGRINRMKLLCEEQLSLMKLSYEQILSYKNITLNYQLQKTTFKLTVAVTLLTIITLFPEEIRLKIINHIIELFSPFFSRN